MAQQTIDIGSAPNDGTGDPIRDAFDKCNDNFTELYAADAALGTAAALDIDIDDTLAADSDSLIPTQQAVKAYVDTAVAGAGGAIEVLDEGVTETSALVSLDFVGAGVVASDDGSGNVTVTVSGGGGAGVDIEDEGVAEASGATVLNFTGAGVSATDVGGGQVDIAIPGGADQGVIHLQDQKASGTDAGTFTTGAWQTRTLNTAVVNTITGASLASNQITLPAGTYDIMATAPGFQVNNHQARLQNITDTATTLTGTSARSRSASTTDGTSDSTIRGRFTIAGAKVFELQHRCETTKSTDGFGIGTGNSWGGVVYADVFIRKVA